MAGRKVEFFSADTGGNPAGTKTKVQELVERDKVDVILGPLAAFELLAITDYIARAQDAAAEPRRRRGHDAAPAQSVLPARLGDLRRRRCTRWRDYAAKEMKLKRIVIASPRTSPSATSRWAASSRRSRRTAARSLKKMWPPLVTPDYTPYVAQIADCDGVCQGFAGSNPLRFMKAYASAGLKFPVVTGETGGDDALLQELRRRGARPRSAACPYTLDLDTDGNKRFVDGMLKNFDTVPGQYAALPLRQLPGGRSRPQGARRRRPATRSKLMAALRAVNLTDTPRGPIKFDHFGNVIGDFYIRSIEQGRRQIRPQALEQDDQDLPERQPVLDLRREEVPRAAGLFARLSAADKC